jgi:hypothetical protein
MVPGRNRIAPGRKGIVPGRNRIVPEQNDIVPLGNRGRFSELLLQEHLKLKTLSQSVVKKN